MHTSVLIIFAVAGSVVAHPQGGHATQIHDDCAESARHGSPTEGSNPKVTASAWTSTSTPYQFQAPPASITGYADVQPNAGCTGPSKCLNRHSANRVAKNLQEMFASYSDELASSFLAPDIEDFTDSVSWLMNNGSDDCVQTLGEATFENRTSLMKAQGMQGSIPWDNLNVFWNCEHVFIRWVSNQNPQPVRGVMILHVVPNTGHEPGSKYEYKVDLIYSEFNSAAWLHNRGEFNGTCPPQPV